MYSPVKISAFLHRKKEPVTIDPNKEYSLVTVKLHHKGVVLREKKKGSLLGSNMYKLSKGQFILSGIDARNGAFGIVPTELDDAIVTNDFWCFDIDESKVKRDFFYWLTNTPLFLDACEKSSKGETQRIRLQKELFFNFEFHFPSVEKQEDFLNRFSLIDASLSELNTEQVNQIAYLAKLRQAILQEAINGQLTAEWRKKNPKLISGDNHASKLLEKIKSEKEQLIKEGKIKRDKPLAEITEAEKPFNLPDGWVWAWYGDIINLTSGQHIEAMDCNRKKEGFPYITGPADFGALHPIVSKWTKKPKVFSKKEDILITVKGSGVGKLNVNNQDKLLISRQLMSIQPILINKTYSFYWLQTSYLYLQGIKDGLIPGISREDIQSKYFPLPPLPEQQAIVERVNEIMAMIDELEKQVAERKDKSERLMQSVLREAFTQ